MADLTPADRNRTQQVPQSPKSDRDRLGASMPAPLTSFVGREPEVTAVVSLLRRPDVRLVTLTGPGGVGKTRLALRSAEAVGHEYADGVAVVDLTPVRDPDLVASVVVRALGLREAGDGSAAVQLVGALQDRHLLLVLDNFEQVAEAAPVVARLLVACPRLRVLATSRVLLHLSGEHAVPVPPLGVPVAGTEDVATVAASEAVRLFVARARAAQLDFVLAEVNAPAVAAIVRRLDGLPLAIELAAARVSVLPPQTLLARLDRRLPLLTGGPGDAPTRQRTMRDALAWSHDLLTPVEQALFRRLAVLSGGLTLEAAEAVASGGRDPGPDMLDGVTSLVAKSFLRQVPGTGSDPRYAMLETVREYGLERLVDSGEEAETRRRHAGFFQAAAEEAGRSLAGVVDPDLLDRLDADLANFGAAFAWLEASGDAEGMLRLAGALGQFCYLRSHRTVGTDWLRRALARGDGTPRARATALVRLAAHESELPERGRPSALAEEALALDRARGDEAAVARDLHALGIVLLNDTDYARAAAVLAEALAAFHRLGDRPKANFARNHLALARYGEGEVATAAALLEEVLATGRELADARTVSMALPSLGLFRADLGDPAGAAACLTEGLTHVRRVGTKERFAGWLACVATLTAVRGRRETAARLFGAADAAREAAGTTFAYPGRTRYARAEAALRRDLGEAAFVAAKETGRELRLDDALAEATRVLEELNPPDAARGLRREHSLTEREREVLRYLVDGATDREIASALSISPRTVGHHVAAILAKLGVETRRGARAHALRYGLTVPDDPA